MHIQLCNSTVSNWSILRLLYRVWNLESMLAFGSITQDAAVSRNAKLSLH